ncbi:MAG TPA: hypothetical protein VMS87_01515 [Roseiarcus sp.]|nr:hypothetical protein [Roseiarcus sp.]
MKALAVVLALFLSPAVAAQPAPPRISELADELQRTQARIAAGDKAAYSEQLTQLKAMAAAIVQAPQETWNNQREADALVIYILSGGAPTELAALLQGEAILESRRALARGAAAYIGGRSAEAAELLGRIDPASLSPRIAGQVAFARSVIATKRDPKAALAFLDWARLIAPGTLVEEAALRREIALLAEARDALRTAMLIRQYAARFARSLYAADFLRDLARLAAEFSLTDEPAASERLAQALAPLDAETKRVFWLALAKISAINGRSGPAIAAANEALRYVRADGEQGWRARLYLDAGKLLSDEYDSAVADLQTIPPARLDPSDAALLAYVRGVAAQLRAAPNPAAIAARGDEAGAAKDAGSAIGLAEEALKRTADLMEPRSP